MSNLCGPRQTYGHTDRQHAIAIPRFELVHRALKCDPSNCPIKHKDYYIGSFLLRDAL